MNQTAFKGICELLEQHRLEYNVIEHQVCRTSSESARARAQAGAPEAIGAKAILTNMIFNDTGEEFVVLVLPGVSRLDSKALKAQVEGLKRFRFATPEEMFTICGVVPGCMPPFACAIFPGVTRLYIDRSLLDYEWIGFNAANLERSIVVRSQDYVLASAPTAVLSFATTTTANHL